MRRTVLEDKEPFMAYSRPTLLGASTLCTPIFHSHKHLGYFVRLCFISVILSQFLYGCCKTFRIFSLSRICFCSESVNEMNSDSLSLYHEGFARVKRGRQAVEKGKIGEQVDPSFFSLPLVTCLNVRCFANSM